MTETATPAAARKMDPFRQLFLQQLQIILAKDAGKESLHELLKTATPSLSAEKVMDDSSRQRALKVLKLRIHPDKHVDDASATRTYQDVQDFYDRCCKTLRRLDRKRKSPSSPTSVGLPLEFNVEFQWPFVNCNCRPAKGTTCCEKEQAILVACQCLNARGAIVLGKRIERGFSLNGEPARLQWSGVQAFFDSHGGSTRLNTSDEIKEEIMRNGPVVSTSFQPASLHGQYFDSNKTHNVLITGWKLTELGEVWTIKPLKGNQKNVVNIAFGQFGVDSHCVAPSRSFVEGTCFQKGPYFDRDLSRCPGWTRSAGIRTPLTTKELETLASCLQPGLVSAGAKKTRFVVRDATKKAHSRACSLKEISWDKKSKTWFMEAIFLD